MPSRWGSLPHAPTWLPAAANPVSPASKINPELDTLSALPGPRPGQATSLASLLLPWPHPCEDPWRSLASLAQSAAGTPHLVPRESCRPYRRAQGPVGGSCPFSVPVSSHVPHCTSTPAAGLWASSALAVPSVCTALPPVAACLTAFVFQVCSHLFQVPVPWPATGKQHPCPGYSRPPPQLHLFVTAHLP